MSAPIFIVGANRSGTTLLRLMLNSHSRIGIPDELVYFRSSFAGHSFDEWRNPQISREDFQKYVSVFLERNQEVLAPLSISDLKKEILCRDEPDFRWPYARTLEAWADTHGKVRWGEKTPGNLFFVDVLIDMFPDARFIYLMRDPRAGVYSMMKTSMFRSGAIINAMNRRKYMTEGLNHLQRFVPETQQTLVKFEDLVQSPESTLRRVCAFLEESFEPHMLEFHRDASKYMKERAISRFNQAATRPIAPEKAESWKSGLSTIQISEVEWICREQMANYGYDRSQAKLPLHRQFFGWLKIAYWHYQNWRHRDSPQFIFQDAILSRTRSRIARLIHRSPGLQASS